MIISCNVCILMLMSVNKINNEEKQQWSQHQYPLQYKECCEHTLVNELHKWMSTKCDWELDERERHTVTSKCLDWVFINKHKSRQKQCRRLKDGSYNDITIKIYMTQQRELEMARKLIIQWLNYNINWKFIWFGKTVMEGVVPVRRNRGQQCWGGHGILRITKGLATSWLFWMGCNESYILPGTCWLMNFIQISDVRGSIVSWLPVSVPVQVSEEEEKEEKKEDGEERRWRRK